jgi:hypothetical protein
VLATGTRENWRALASRETRAETSQTSPFPVLQVRWKQTPEITQPTDFTD